MILSRPGCINLLKFLHNVIRSLLYSSISVKPNAFLLHTPVLSETIKFIDSYTSIAELMKKNLSSRYTKRINGPGRPLPFLQTLAASHNLAVGYLSEQ